GEPDDDGDGEKTPDDEGDENAGNGEQGDRAEGEQPDGCEDSGGDRPCRPLARNRGEGVAVAGFGEATPEPECAAVEKRPDCVGEQQEQREPPSVQLRRRSGELEHVPANARA